MPSPQVLATVSSRAPFQACSSESSLMSTTVSPYLLLDFQIRYSCCNPFPMPLPKRWAAILGNWTRHQLGGFKSNNLKPISSCVGVQVSEALTPTPSLHGKCTVIPHPQRTTLAFGVRCFLVQPESPAPLPANPQPAIRVQARASHPHSLPPIHTSHATPREYLDSPLYIHIL